MSVVAILSTTLLQKTGTYVFTELTTMPGHLQGLPHYVGHPATRYLLDKAGAIYTPGLFNGLDVGQSFYTAQLKDPRKGQAFTVDNPNVTLDDLKRGLVTRIE